MISKVDPFFVEVGIEIYEYHLMMIFLDTNYKCVIIIITTL
jgi:hypothetical protein